MHSSSRRPTGSGIIVVLVHFLVICIFLIASAHSQDSQHPLDGLVEREYGAVLSTLRREGLVDATTRFHSVHLHEPPKDRVRQWTPGSPLAREALVIARTNRTTFEGVVAIDRSEVVKWRELPSTQPNLLPSESVDAEQIVRNDRRWQQAIRRRGIDPSDEVICVALAITQKQSKTRRLRIACFDGRQVRNFWGRPIEGLLVVVDLDEQRIAEFSDLPGGPVPQSPVDFDSESVGEMRRPPNPISTVQPLGPSFRVNGSRVRWQNWQFHVRIDPQFGPVISMVQYQDEENLRSVMYQMSLSEVFVPYMDPSPGWHFRAYMDVGEHGVGQLAAPLEPGVDCPPNAYMLDAVFANGQGIPNRRAHAACLFERYAGDMAWRHHESRSGTTESRKRIDLVLRFIAVVGNYDYIVDWVFRQDGTIKVAVGATGIAQVKSVPQADDRERAAVQRYGRMVAPHTLAVHHDHYFAFRLDLDVDGPNNSFMTDRLTMKEGSEANPRKSIWTVETIIAERERDAMMKINLQRPSLWRAINPNVNGPMGYPVSYQIKPGSNALPLIREDDPLQQFAGFTRHHLWVTPYVDDERHAAGRFPNLHSDGQGLPVWTAADRAIQNADLVFWYTLGFHHVVRAEDWPVMPVNWHDFEVRPFDFFTRNPAIDLP